MIDTRNDDSRAIAGLAKPRNHDEGDQQRKEHRDGGVDGNRSHIGSHQPGHERHWQEGGDDGKCRQDRGIPNFVDGMDRGFVMGPETHLQMPVGILDDHDRIVHENAD